MILWTFTYLLHICFIIYNLKQIIEDYSRYNFSYYLLVLVLVIVLVLSSNRFCISIEIIKVDRLKPIPSRDTKT